MQLGARTPNLAFEHVTEHSCKGFRDCNPAEHRFFTLNSSPTRNRVYLINLIRVQSPWEGGRRGRGEVGVGWTGVRLGGCAQAMGVGGGGG